MESVGLAVVHRDPEGVELGGRIGRARIKRSRFLLRCLPHLPIELGRRGLVEADLPIEPQDPDRFEEPQGPQRIGVAGVLGRLEAHLHVALCSEVVDLIRLRLLDDADEVRGVRQIAAMEKERGLLLVRIDIELIDPLGIEGG
jgi:hypothetical protein